MNNSKEYGTALFALAKECAAEAEYKEALDTVLAVLRENPAYIDLLASPNIPKNERTGAIQQAFSGRIPAHVVSFLQLLCEKGHIRDIAACVAEYNALYDASMKITAARVVSAVPLTDREKNRLQQKLEKISGHTVVPAYAVDPSLIGGMTVEMDGKVIDGSLHSRLQEIKDVIAK